MKEIWKDIKGYEGLYKVSSLGRICSYDKEITNKLCTYILKGRFLKQTDDNKGYYQVTLYKNGKRTTFKVHKIVANAFLNKRNYKKMENEQNININKLQVNHKNEFDKHNNCIDNLEWCTQLYNCNYGTRNQRVNKRKNINK